MIPAVHPRGANVGGLLRYLFGPGKREEHVDPRVVAAWDGAGPLPGLQPPTRAGGRYDVRGLTELLVQPVRAGFRPPATPVWHCSIRNHRSDRILSDGQWAHIAADITAAVGLAPHGDLDAVRWVAVRHGDDHIHVVATLVRQDRRTVWPWQDKRKSQAACRDLEQRYGLYRVAPPGAGSRRWPSPAELNKTARLDAQATASAPRGRRRGGLVAPREQLRRRVRQVAAIVCGEDEFFARLAQAGVLVRLRNGCTPDEVSGYAVGLPGHVTATGDVVWYGGGRLAPDLTLPRLRSRWAATPLPTGGPARLAAMGSVPPDVTGRAAQTVRDAAEAMRAAADPVTVSAIAAAAADLLTATARAWEGTAGGPISEAADWLDRAAHQPHPRRHAGQVREAGRLRAMARLIGLAGVQPRDRDTATALHLLHTLATFAETLADLRRAQDRLDQAQAARTDAGQLAAATVPPHATTPAGTFAATTRHPPAPDRPLGSPRHHRRRQQ